ncbi:uncharacterized protein [Clytia hemisphaerica]|uniref:uncharacterized protein n=1 Tax=Clytia hemisphaerica TaxID=252671 RepID=UPI0034D5111A
MGLRCPNMMVVEFNNQKDSSNIFHERCSNFINSGINITDVPIQVQNKILDCWDSLKYCEIPEPNYYEYLEQQEQQQEFNDGLSDYFGSYDPFETPCRVQQQESQMANQYNLNVVPEYQYLTNVNDIAHTQVTGNQEATTFYQEATAVHQEATAVHQEPIIFHQEATAVHQEPITFHQEATAVHQEQTHTSLHPKNPG